MMFLSNSTLIAALAAAFALTTSTHAADVETRCLRVDEGVCTNPTAPLLATCTSTLLFGSFSGCCPADILIGNTLIGSNEPTMTCVLFGADPMTIASIPLRDETKCIRILAGAGCTNPTAPHLATCTSTTDTEPFSGCCPNDILGGYELGTKCSLFSPSKSIVADDTSNAGSVNIASIPDRDETSCIRILEVEGCTNPTAPHLATCTSTTDTEPFSGCCPNDIIEGYELGTNCILFNPPESTSADDTSNADPATDASIPDMSSGDPATGASIPFRDETRCIRSLEGARCTNPTAPHLASCTSTTDTGVFRGCCPTSSTEGYELGTNCILYTPLKSTPGSPSESTPADDICNAATVTFASIPPRDETKCIRILAGAGCSNPTAPYLAACTSTTDDEAFSGCCPTNTTEGYELGTNCDPCNPSESDSGAAPMTTALLTCAVVSTATVFSLLFSMV